MGPPTATQRFEQLEAKAAEIEQTMAAMVSQAVEAAMQSMKHSLTEILLEGQSAAAQKHGDDMDALAMRLEGRVNRAREHQEQFINLAVPSHKSSYLLF